MRPEGKKEVMRQVSVKEEKYDAIMCIDRLTKVGRRVREAG